MVNTVASEESFGLHQVTFLYAQIRTAFVRLKLWRPCDAGWAAGGIPAQDDKGLKWVSKGGDGREG